MTCYAKCITSKISLILSLMYCACVKTRSDWNPVLPELSFSRVALRCCAMVRVVVMTAVAKEFNMVIRNGCCNFSMYLYFTALVAVRNGTYLNMGLVDGRIVL